MLKAKIYVVLTMLLLLASARVNAYVLGDTVNIRISSANTNFPQIDIYKTGNTIKIVYSVFEAVKDNTAEAALYNRLVDITKSKNSRENVMDSVVEKYRKENYIYNRDSVIINKKLASAYFKLIDAISTASYDKLSNGIDRNKIIVIDGLDINFKIVSSSHIIKVIAWSPTSTSHPILHQLLTASFDLYRNKKGNAFFKNGTAHY